MSKSVEREEERGRDRKEEEDADDEEPGREEEERRPHLRAAPAGADLSASSGSLPREDPAALLEDAVDVRVEGSASAACTVSRPRIAGSRSSATFCAICSHSGTAGVAPTWSSWRGRRAAVGSPERGGSSQACAAPAGRPRARRSGPARGRGEELDELPRVVLPLRGAEEHEARPAGEGDAGPPAPSRRGERRRRPESCSSAGRRRRNSPEVPRAGDLHREVARGELLVDVRDLRVRDDRREAVAEEARRRTPPPRRNAGVAEARRACRPSVRSGDPSGGRRS